MVVLDTRRPRNRFASHSHGFLGHDGRGPSDILEDGREQLARYADARMLDAEAVDARAEEGGFSVDLVGGATLSARKLILAFGLEDGLPDVPGLAERWGRSVLHCPYCHGYEFNDRPLGVLWRGPMSVHQAAVVSRRGPVTLFLNGADPSPDDLAGLHGHDVAVERAPVAELQGAGLSLAAVALADGRVLPVDALYIAPELRFASPLAERLGLAVDLGPMGPVIRTDADKATSLPGVWAAGDIARQPHSVTWAAADGVTAGVSGHRALMFGG